MKAFIKLIMERLKYAFDIIAEMEAIEYGD